MHSETFQDLCKKINETISEKNKRVQQIKKYDTCIWHMKDICKSISDIAELKTKYSNSEKTIKNLKTEFIHKSNNKIISHKNRMSTMNTIEEFYVEKITTAANIYEFKALMQDRDRIINEALGVEKELDNTNNEYKLICHSLSKKNLRILKQIQICEKAENRSKIDILNKIKPAKNETSFLKNEIIREKQIDKNWK